MAINQLIPNFDTEMQILNELSPTGWIIGFNLTVYKGAEHLHTTYPESWRTIYETKNYFFGDPIALWSMTRTGAVRWSEVKFPDLLGVLKQARHFKLNYGMALARKLNKKRSFLTLSRSDREFTDAEIMMVDAKFKIWTELVLHEANLTDGELEVLRALRDGYGQADIAEHLSIAESTVKQRAISATKKLGSNNRTQAVATAITRKLI